MVCVEAASGTEMCLKVSVRVAVGKDALNSNMYKHNIYVLTVKRQKAQSLI